MNIVKAIDVFYKIASGEKEKHTIEVDCSESALGKIQKVLEIFRSMSCGCTRNFIIDGPKRGEDYKNWQFEFDGDGSDRVGKFSIDGKKI